MANIKISSSVFAGGDFAFQTESDGNVYTVVSGVTLSSDQSAVEIGNGFENNQFRNGGNIRGGSQDGVVIDTKNNSLVNLATGNIQGGDRGVYVSDANSSVTNLGGITGGFAGILAGGDNFKLSNSGGLIYGAAAGVYSDAQHATVANAGTIYSAGIGIDFEVNFTKITLSNNGTIHGGARAIQSASDSGALTLTNAGTIEGAIALGAEDDTVRNTGAIAGSVDLGDGTNLFDGHEGTVDGIVNGGAKTDRIIAGNDGETIGGGLGHDTLVGGFGADTFLFASAHNADRDTVRDFNVSQDHFSLDHARFLGLTAGATPVFATGSKATGASDHLFYNSSTGGLFYDRDGSGSTYDAVQFASLDKGLHLTASNFVVT